MSVNNLFEKGNKFFQLQNHISGLEVYVDIWLKYPQNTRLYEEINKKLKKFKHPILPSISQNQINKFFELQKIGQTSSVIKTLIILLQKDSNNILLISLLGTFYGLNGDYDEAIKFQKAAVEKAPFEITFYINLSETLRKVNRFDESLLMLYFAKILSLRDISIDHLIAKIQTNLKNYSKADLIYNYLIKEENISDQILYSYCDNLIKFKKEKEAIVFLKKQELKNKKDHQIQILIGLAYFKQKEFALAKTFFSKAISLNIDNEESYTMLGDCHEKLGNLSEAKKYYDKSLEINPNNSSTINNIAAWNFFNGNADEALKLFNLSVTKNKYNHDTKYYLSQCQLSQSNYLEGWLNFEYRWLSNGFNSSKLNSNLPKFKFNTGKKNLLIWGEQGLGDQVLFIRFLEDIMFHVDNLFLKIDNRLQPIISRSYPKIKYFNKNIDVNLDSQLALGDLGSFFLKDNSYFSSRNNTYLTSDSKITNDLKNSLKTKDKLVCGLSWTSTNEEIGTNKSITLETLKPILSLNNITFVDLQYNNTQKEREIFYHENGIKIIKLNHIDSLNDINSVTSLIDVCDFVVTISNSNAHIAGALGKKSFLLLPKGKGKLWYWNSIGNKSIWYKSIQIINQKNTGSWEDPIKELSKIIREMLNE